MGRIDLVNSKRLPKEKDLIRFTVYNEVFYNDTLKYLPIVLNDLNLKINNISHLEIAIDFHDSNARRKLRTEILRKTNMAKLHGRIVKDRDQEELEGAIELNKLTLNKSRPGTLYINAKKNNKTNKYGLRAYDKTKEIEVSGKEYIQEYHKMYNSKVKKVHRLEIYYHYDELRRYINGKKNNMQVEVFFTKLFDTAFLYDLR